MSTLAEIESAAAQLRPEEIQELILFLSTRLQATGVDIPSPRTFDRAKIHQWIAEDEEGYRRFLAGA
jgi:hypothetical protein